MTKGNELYFKLDRVGRNLAHLSNFADFRVISNDLDQIKGIKHVMSHDYFRSSNAPSPFNHTMTHRVSLFGIRNWNDCFSEILAFTGKKTYFVSLYVPQANFVQVKSKLQEFVQLLVDLDRAANWDAKIIETPMDSAVLLNVILTNNPQPQIFYLGADIITDILETGAEQCGFSFMDAGELTKQRNILVKHMCNLNQLVYGYHTDDPLKYCQNNLVKLNVTSTEFAGFKANYKKAIKSTIRGYKSRMANIAKNNHTVRDWDTAFNPNHRDIVNDLPVTIAGLSWFFNYLNDHNNSLYRKSLDKYVHGNAAKDNEIDQMLDYFAKQI